MAEREHTINEQQKGKKTLDSDYSLGTIASILIL